MSEQDWDAEAEAMAQYVAEEFSDRRRGAIPGRQSRVSVVFGNESGKDPAELEYGIATLRDDLAREGIRVLGFGVAPGDGTTWAMIVESEDLALLEDLAAGGLA